MAVAASSTLSMAQQPAARESSVTLPLDYASSELEKAKIQLPAAPDGRIGFAVVGLGRLALEEILPAFSRCKKARLAALVSGTPSKLKSVADHYGVPESARYNYDNFEEIVRNPDVQVVYIVLPNSMHLDFTRRAAKAGKHVLTEKPMAVSAKECEEMIAACEQAGRLLMVAYRMQYEPYNRELLRLARSGELGRLRTITAQNSQTEGRPQQWRMKRALAGGGALPDIGLYCLNAARFLTGEEPIEVQGSVYSSPGDPRFQEVEEVCAFQLRFPSGITAQGISSYNAHNSRRIRLDFENGWAELDPAFSYAGQQMKICRKVSDKAEDIAMRKLEEKSQFATEMDHMADCVASNRQPHTGGPEGLQDQKLMETIYESAKAGRTIKLQPREGLDVTRGPQPAED
ncbi:Gfo/Idh/MocA family protein [Granulicella cerasi]|uniref:Gfo/Idh/MocA family protein n=1 Tax=Granulicella cerasi TaxID=741063 RepID=A0ABW1ZCI7_9BACT|nr:Gfo/Idh/MocA family oxidoreductase [Granulicella cerasi]